MDEKFELGDKIYFVDDYKVKSGIIDSMWMGLEEKPTIYCKMNNVVLRTSVISKNPNDAIIKEIQRLTDYKYDLIKGYDEQINKIRNIKLEDK